MYSPQYMVLRHEGNIGWIPQRSVSSQKGGLTGVPRSDRNDATASLFHSNSAARWAVTKDMKLMGTKQSQYWILRLLLD